MGAHERRLICRFSFLVQTELGKKIWKAVYERNMALLIQLLNGANRNDLLYTEMVRYCDDITVLLFALLY